MVLPRPGSASRLQLPEIQGKELSMQMWLSRSFLCKKFLLDCLSKESVFTAPKYFPRNPLYMKCLDIRIPTVHALGLVRIGLSVLSDFEDR
jgi:hypothetical protein